ncbi:hypothetical protein JCM11251_005710 [Rhodosporidiobolus azoricus]
MDSGFVSGKNNIYCWLGNHNGTFPNGTTGGGTWTEFGHYSPTMSEMMACQAANGSWSESVKYGYWIAYVLIAYFAVTAAWTHFSAWNNLNRSIGLLPVLYIPLKLKALIRSLDMPRPDSRLPVVGAQLVSLGLLLSCCVVCFAIFPYYRPPNFGSAPLGLRSEWIATALIVFIVATAVKRNALGFLTGLPYPRLLDLHKTISWVSFFGAIVHTVSMIVRANAQQPWSYTWKTQPLNYGWAAWGALISMAWLCTMSLGPIRRFSHEFFYVFHMSGVLLFIVFMYYHCDQLLGSWAWLHAAVVVLGAATLYRFIVTAWHTAAFFRPQRASVNVVADGALLVKVDVGTMSWQAGDHVYLRFGSFNLFPWQSHPFTIANLPQSSYAQLALATDDRNGEDLEKRTSPSPPRGVPTLSSSPSSSSLINNEMHFVLRPHSGFTSRLFRLAPMYDIPVYIDGPYSSHPSALSSLTSSDSAVLVAGGTGASFVLPLLLQGLRQEGGGRLRRVELVWAVRKAECFEWYKDTIDRIVLLGKEYSVDINIRMHLSRSTPTDGNGEKKVVEEDDIEAGPSSFSTATIPPYVEVCNGRVDGAAAVEIAITVAGKGGAKCVAVISCGPPTLALAVRNVAAKAQLAILKGKFPGGAVEEVELVEELFSC